MTAELSQSVERVETFDRAPHARPTALEGCLVLAICMAGFALRSAWPSRLAVEHFDEGVYASNIFFSGEKGDERYPDQHLYAPPLLPLLIEWTMVVLGPSNLAAMIPGIVVGSLTVPLVWWAGRCWFGPAAGLASATLVALNDVHIFFSRTALTDVLLCFLLVAAVYLFWEAQATGSRLALVAAGAVTGLAWWTKYNGWLPLAVGLAGVVPWRVIDAWMATRAGHAPRLSTADCARRLAGAVMKWAVVAAIAFLAWSPWLWSLQDKGGYKKVMDNHRGYVVGLSGWLDALCQQASRLEVLDAWPSLHGPLFAMLVCLLYNRFATGRSTWNILHDNRMTLIGLAAVGGLSLAIGSSAILGAAASAGIASPLFRKTPFRIGDQAGSSRSLAGWLVAAWFLGMFLTTPLYTPYPRLTLPWLAACWFGSGILVRRVVVCREDPASGTAARRDGEGEDCGSPGFIPSLTAAQRSSVVVLVLVLAITGASLEPCALRRRVPGWEPRTGLAEAIPKLIRPILGSPSGEGQADLESIAVYTYGEPAALFQLRLVGIRWVRAVQNLDFARPEARPPRLPSFVIVGPHARRSPGFGAQLLAGKDRLRLLASAPVAQSHLVALDETAVHEAPREVVLELYRIE